MSVNTITPVTPYSTEYGEKHTLKNAWIMQVGNNVAVIPGITKITAKRKIEIATQFVAKFHPEKSTGATGEQLIATFDRYANRKGTITVQFFTVTDNSTGQVIREAYDVLTENSSRDVAKENWLGIHVA